MTFYFWQQTQWQYLMLCLKANRFPHALLLSGVKNLGKTHFARMLAKKLLCRQVQTEMPCGCCRDCQLMALEEGHPDLYHIQPEEEGAVIKIESIRELIAELGQTAQQGQRKVVIIAPAENMNRASVNALLKTLEEPIGNMVFILISHQAGLLPATLLSRCQKLVFTIPDFQKSLNWLHEQIPDKSHESANEYANLLAITENIPLRALMFYQQKIHLTYYSLIQNFLLLLLEEISPLQMALLCMELEFNLALDSLWWTMAQLLRIQLTQQLSEGFSELRELLIRASEKISHFMLLEWIQKLLMIKKQMIGEKANLNKQLLFENFFSWSVP